MLTPPHPDLGLAFVVSTRVELTILGNGQRVDDLVDDYHQSESSFVARSALAARCLACENVDEIERFELAALVERPAG